MVASRIPKVGSGKCWHDVIVLSSTFYLNIFMCALLSHVSHVSHAGFHIPIASFAGNTLDSTTFPPNLQCSSIDDSATAFKPVPRSGKL